MSDSSPERPAGVISRRRRAAGAISSGLAEASPTWELELLLSGAVLVALFQLSGVLDRGFDRLTPHATDAVEMPIIYAYMYGKAMVIALIATFVLHLASRGYWVGLVGLHSVFPDGVRWEELRFGPFTRDAMRERLPSLPPTIARLDNFCSALFSFGFLVALFFGASLLLMAAAGGLAYVIAVVAFGGRGTLRIFYVVGGVIVLVPIAVSFIDRLIGSRVDPAGRSGRLLRRGAVMYYWMSALPLFGPIYLTLTSNWGRRLVNVLLSLAMFGVLGFVGVSLFTRLDALGVNNYAYFAQPDRFSVNASYYESQRRPGEPLPRTPTIQSDVIREPFVKLFIPYSPERHNRAIAATCSGLQPLRPLGMSISRRDADVVPDSAATAVLRCVAQVHPVTLNGASLTNLEFRFYEHPANSLRGVITYIPTAGLPRGRNVLTVGRVPPPAGSRRTTPLGPYVIPFWL